MFTDSLYHLISVISRSDQAFTENIDGCFDTLASANVKTDQKQKKWHLFSILCSWKCGFLYYIFWKRIFDVTNLQQIYLTYLAFTLSKWVLLCTYITMVHYLFPLHKFFKLEVRYINTQPDILTCTDLILVEPILNNFRSCFKVLEYGIHYQTTLKPPHRLTRLSDWSNHF